MYILNKTHTSQLIKKIKKFTNDNKQSKKIMDFYYSFAFNKKEGFEQASKFIVKQGSDVYDDCYCSIWKKPNVFNQHAIKKCNEQRSENTSKEHWSSEASAFADFQLLNRHTN